MMVFFRTRLWKILIWQKFSEKRESDFNKNIKSKTPRYDITQLDFMLHHDHKKLQNFIQRNFPD